MRWPEANCYLFTSDSISFWVLEQTKNEQLLRRELTLLDASESPVFFTLFGAQALQLPHSALEDNPLVAIKGKDIKSVSP